MNATRKVILKYLGLGAVAVPVAGIGLIAAMGPGTLERQREAARRDGLPLLPEDLKRTPPVPDEQNAAPLLRELHHLWRSKPDKEIDPWIAVAHNMCRKSEDASFRAAFAKGVGKFPEFVRLAEAAAERPHCDFGCDWSRGMKLEFPELSVTRHAASFFAARALIAGEPSSAFSDIARAAHLGTLLQETPCLLPTIAGSTALEMAHKSYLDALKRFGPSPLARKALNAFGPIPYPEFYCRGEVVIGIATMTLLREGKMNRTEEDIPESEGMCGDGAFWETLAKVSPLAGPYWEERLILFWREVYAILRATRDDPIQRGNLLEAQVNRWSEDKLHTPQNLIALILGPMYAQGIISTPQKAATARALRETALSLLETKAKTGAFPEKPSLPRDPYSNRPLGYRREGAGCALWSVGPDGKDDGGVAYSKDRRLLDLVVRL